MQDQALALGGTHPSRPQLLYFFASTSGASRRVDGFLAQVLQHRGNHDTFQLYRIDCDRNPDIVERLKVDEIPSVLVVTDGVVRARLANPSGIRPIMGLLEPWLK